ncbi:hypothetical protein QJU96_09235 [Pasteurella skyensis]|uniref:Uncharacterized protein n=1 Tax=Phocoenobacter skyensis TaxID=97481 RepID=A0AAJ6NF32_9PAST|nr:hypothetical protein [Pasteurella skyensis]MDP8171462.1 hypothetical protein [Pasteurella skyensis]MDP8175657.1 hypothetical protein [Pasteurella skyensis]
MKKFTETQLEQAIIELLAQENILHLHGGDISRKSDEVLMLDVFREFLQKSYRLQGITDSEINALFAS